MLHEVCQVSMKLVQGDMWKVQDDYDYLCITTNAISKADGSLVMGAGIAKQANEHNPRLKVEFGKQLRDRGLFNKFYGLLLAEQKYIAFQTKIHWRDKSPIDVVARSCDMLRRLAEKYPERTFALPFPAISNGGLTPQQVMPYLKPLPDNVTVFHLQSL